MVKLRDFLLQQKNSDVSYFAIKGHMTAADQNQPESNS